MDLLKTILRTCECEEYYDNFKSNNIDSSALKILSDEDLQLVGIQDEEKRQNVLRKLNNLRIPAEKKIDLSVDKQYTQLALDVISEQLNRLKALVICAAKRQDTDICDVQLTPAVNCVENILCSLEKQIDSFECKVLDKKGGRRKKRRKIYVILPALTVATLALIFCRRHISN